MHLYDVEVGNLGANAVVGGGLPGIVGAALAFQMRDEKRVAVAFFGDGATNTGTFHESHEPRPALEGAGDLRPREQRLGRVDACEPAAPASRGRARQARVGLRDEAHRGRRPGRRGRLPRDARRPRARALAEGAGAAAPPHAPPRRPLRRRPAGVPRQGRAEASSARRRTRSSSSRRGSRSPTTSSRRSTPR